MGRRNRKEAGNKYGERFDKPCTQLLSHFHSRLLSLPLHTRTLRFPPSTLSSAMRTSLFSPIPERQPTSEKVRPEVFPHLCIPLLHCSGVLSTADDKRLLISETWTQLYKSIGNPRQLACIPRILQRRAWTGSRHGAFSGTNRGQMKYHWSAACGEEVGCR